MTDRTKPPTFTLALLHPRYWLVCLGFALWWLLVQLLPFRVQMFLGGKLGLLLGRISKRRCHIAKRNLELCFPQLNEAERDKLFRCSLESLGRGVFDTAIAWFWSKSRFKRILEVRGAELIADYYRDGQGVLLLSPHFTSLELTAPGLQALGLQRASGVYRPHDNPVYDFIQSRGRGRHQTDHVVLPKKDVRGMVKALRQGRALVYLPDQDYGRAHSVFVPFFGITAATLSAPAQLARLGKAKVFGYIATRKEDGSGYLVEIVPGPEHYGKGSDEENAQRLNAFVEDCVRRYPDQYLWVHRRFKTRPEGTAGVY